jgi:hypothetical protein
MTLGMRLMLLSPHSTKLNRMSIDYELMSTDCFISTLGMSSMFWSSL